MADFVEIDVKSFWWRLEYTLKSQGRTMQWLNSQCNLSDGYFFVMKSKKTIPSIHVLARVAEVLDCTIDYLVLGESSKNKGEDFIEKSLISMYRSDPSYKIAFRKMLDEPAIARLIAGNN